MSERVNPKRFSADGGCRFRTVGVIMGGVSQEREISLRSGRAIAEGLRQADYDVMEIDLRQRKISVPAGIEAVFIALHGEFGEDGQIQSLLEEQAIPYTGAGPEGSRMAFDKKIAKKLMVENRICTPDYEVLRLPEQKMLPLPVVVKPVAQGSSFGVHRVTQASEWGDAFSDAFSYNGEVLVERYIEGKEIAVGIVGDEILPAIEIRAPDNDYNYTAKYTQGVTEYLVPAPISEAEKQACRQLAWRTFQVLRCRGMGRVDLRLTPRGEPYVLELNTIPGFTETSLLPKAAGSVGCSFSSLCDKIMCLATMESLQVAKKG